jgi:hypothetical protein
MYEYLYQETRRLLRSLIGDFVRNMGCHFWSIQYLQTLAATLETYVQKRVAKL